MARIGISSFSALAACSVLATSAFMACSTDPLDLKGAAASGGASSGGDGTGGDGGASSGPAAEELAFDALESDFKKTCGGQCHDLGVYTPPTPPTFLAGPDSYKSIKAYPGIVVADYTSSIILNKGGHEGPDLKDTPDLLNKITDWLKLEAIAFQAVTYPTTDPVAIKMGPNDVDMTGAEVSGLTGVHLLFNASLVGGFLSLDTITVHVPAGTDVHVYKPQFIRVLAAPDANMQTDFPDVSDTFSNTDQTFPNGADTVLTPGNAIFTAAGWENFNFASDKIKISVQKLEPGKVIVTQAQATCKNVPLFTSGIVPAMSGQNAAIVDGNGAAVKCSNCHGGTANITLGGDQTTACNQVLAYLNGADITKSTLLIHTAVGGGHGGPTLSAAATTALTNVFVTNKAAFF